ncbi:MAG TPA: hypothetical protein VFL13_16180 [Candidatus Baltobacteraceae bacterium]|nr:hypothetical protein [Candidatus Baltobacteraceae bacterium]
MVTAAFVFASLAAQAAGGRSCGVQTVNSRGALVRVYFAKNGAVQRYELARSTNNPENDHDALVDLQTKFGPEDVNAPALRIVQFRDNGSGMRVPVKAVDSCGRVISLQ